MYRRRVWTHRKPHESPPRKTAIDRSKIDPISSFPPGSRLPYGRLPHCPGGTMRSWIPLLALLATPAWADPGPSPGLAPAPALTLTQILTRELVQDSASQPYLSWITMFWITMFGDY